jgi:hypothetical protein
MKRIKSLPGSAPFQIHDLRGWLLDIKKALGILKTVDTPYIRNTSWGHRPVEEIKNSIIEECVEHCENGIRAIQEAFPNDEELREEQ